MSVVALSGSIMSIFTVTMNALASMAANFVGSELGKGNIEQALSNSKELKGFNTTMAIGLAIIGISFAFATPSMSFLSHANGVDNHEKLVQVS